MPKVEYYTSLSAGQKMAALQIWNAEYPKQLCMPGMAAFDAFLKPLVNPGYYLLYNQSNEMIGWAATFSVQAARCFFIMVTGAAQGKGYGTLLLNALKAKEDSLFGWAIDHDKDIKADGTPYPSPTNFYIKNKFIVNTTLRLETEVLSAVNIVWQAGGAE